MDKYILPSVGLSLCLLSGCSPTVKLEAPEKPIVIDMNVNLRVEKAADEAIKSNPDIF